MRGHQLVEHVVAVEPHGAHPGQVVEADLVDAHPLGRDAEPARELALEADRHVAQPDRAVAGVEQRARDDPDRVREVDDPGVVRRQRAHALGDLEHDRHGPQRLREAAGAGRLLADAAAGERDRLVAQPRRLTADADLDQHGVGAVDRAVEIVGHLERPVEAVRGQHPPGQPADDLAPLGVDVVQHELAHVEPVALAPQAGHQLGRVGRPAADHRDLHPFTPVSVTPSTNAFCAAKNSRITGAMNSSVAAIVRFHCTW